MNCDKFKAICNQSNRCSHCYQWHIRPGTQTASAQSIIATVPFAFSAAINPSRPERINSPPYLGGLSPFGT